MTIDQVIDARKLFLHSESQQINSIFVQWRKFINKNGCMRRILYNSKLKKVVKFSSTIILNLLKTTLLLLFQKKKTLNSISNFIAIKYEIPQPEIYTGSKIAKCKIYKFYKLKWSQGSNSTRAYITSVSSLPCQEASPSPLQPSSLLRNCSYLQGHL